MIRHFFTFGTPTLTRSWIQSNLDRRGMELPGVVVVVIFVAGRLVDGVRTPLLVALLAHGVLGRPHYLNRLDVP